MSLRLLSLLVILLSLVTLLSIQPIPIRFISSAATPPQLTFPLDHGAHPQFASEWWYINLLVRTTLKDGSQPKDLSYLVSFSRIVNSKNLLTSRYDHSTKAFSQNTLSGDWLSVTLPNNLLSVKFTGTKTFWLIQQTSSPSLSFALQGNTNQVGTFRLLLKDHTPKPGGNSPLLWGCTGNISVFSPNDTFYYSLPNLDVSGSIVDINGQERIVKIGKAWIDHQWFNTTPPSDWIGHFWSSFHFTTATGNPSDLLNNPTLPHESFAYVVQLYKTGPKYDYWVSRNKQGTNSCGTSISVQPTTFDQNSGFPSTWTAQTILSDNKNLNNPSISFQSTSVSNNQIYTPPFGPQFFEPSAFFSGTYNSLPFTGLGFMETHLKISDLTSRHQ